jgi:hypothetical protein
VKVVAVAVVAFVAMGLAACSSSSVSEGAPPPVALGPPVNLVVLGGDDAFSITLDRGERTRDGWPQLLYRQHLPARATLVDLAAPQATAEDVRDAQVLRALAIHATIAVVWVDGDQAALATALQTLAHSGVTVLAVATPSSARAVQGAATASGARFVSVPDGASQQAVADAVAGVLGPVS